MPTPKLSPEQLQEAADAWLGHNRSVAKAAAALDLNYNTFRSRLSEAQRQGLHLSDGARDAVSRARLAPEETSGGWLHTYDENGKKLAATFWRAPQTTPEDIAERLREALIGIPAPEPVTLVTAPNSDLLTLIPVADAHIGLMAWGKETGEDWDTRKGAARLTEWVNRALVALPPSSKCVLLFAGDLLHADDSRSETPASKHRLDTDTRHFKTLEMVIEAVARIADAAMQYHETVVLRFLPGNHDPHASIAVMFAIAERYRNEPRVQVQKEPSEFFVHQFGKVLVTAHHGHRAKAPQMVHFIADEYAVLWGKTKYRYLFTGHMHHHKSQDIGGVTWKQLPAMTARDAYTVSNAYVSRAQLQGFTYHRERGETTRVVIGPEE
jgi:hypothetical protein